MPKPNHKKFNNTSVTKLDVVLEGYFGREENFVWVNFIDMFTSICNLTFMLIVVYPHYVNSKCNSVAVTFATKQISDAWENNF